MDYVVASTGGSAIKMVGLIATPYAGLDCFKNLPVSALLSAIIIIIIPFLFFLLKVNAMMMAHSKYY